MTRPVTAPAHEALAPQLDRVAKRLGSAVRSAELLSPLRGREHPRAAFCLTLADGRRVKLRRTRNEQLARELEELLVALAPSGLPRVLARVDCALVLEWIPGEPFSKQPATRRRVAWAGSLLGEIHRAGAQLSRAQVPGPTPASELARAREHLDALVRLRTIEGAEADALHATLRRRLPDRATQGIVHGDFAPENLVVDREGALRVIDNESVQPGILDLDVARVWARWPMSPDCWRAFLDAYSARAGRRCDDARLAGWKLRARLVSAWYRSVLRLPGASAAVEEMRNTASELERSTPNPSPPGAP